MDHFCNCYVSLCTKFLTFGRKSVKAPNIRPKPNILPVLAAEYSVSAVSLNSCFGRTLARLPTSQ
jgi:hypothetical protein